MPVPKQWRAYFRSHEWRKVIRPRILERAGNRCERCMVPNHAHVFRCAGGMWYDQKVTWEGVNGFWRDAQGQPAKRPRRVKARNARRSERPGAPLISSARSLKGPTTCN